MRIVNKLLSAIGAGLARYLSRRVHIHGAAPATPQDLLLATLRPGDVLLVEGHSRVSTAIKYLTQSTWSHAALYVGDHLATADRTSAHCFVEADIIAGVRSIGAGEFAGHHTRICRPVGLDAAACGQVTRYAIDRIGSRYDLRNIFDLARYLLPTPPVPTSMRRRMLAFGSGDPTRAICSTLIAQAFQSIRYPILPIVNRRDASTPECPGCIAEAMHIRHHSLFAPRDFDVSPYFQIVKPWLAHGFDYRSIVWEDPEEGDRRVTATDLQPMDPVPMPDQPRNVLFLCTHNSARSILAEGLMTRLGAGGWVGHSAGSHPSGRVNPFALEVLQSLGCATDGMYSKHWDAFAEPRATAMDFIITVCDNAAGEACPLWPGDPVQLHWGFADPSVVGRDDAARRAAFHATARQIGARIGAFIDQQRIVS